MARDKDYDPELDPLKVLRQTRSKLAETQESVRALKERRRLLKERVKVLEADNKVLADDIDKWREMARRERRVAERNMRRVSELEDALKLEKSAHEKARRDRDWFSSRNKVVEGQLKKAEDDRQAAVNGRTRAVAANNRLHEELAELKTKLRHPCVDKSQLPDREAVSGAPHVTPGSVARALLGLSNWCDASHLRDCDDDEIAGVSRELKTLAMDVFRHLVAADPDAVAGDDGVPYMNAPIDPDPDAAGVPDPDDPELEKAFQGLKRTLGEDGMLSWERLLREFADVKRAVAEGGVATYEDDLRAQRAVNRSHLRRWEEHDGRLDRLERRMLPAENRLTVAEDRLDGLTGIEEDPDE